MCFRRGDAYKITLKLMCQLLWVLGLIVGLTGLNFLLKYREYSLFIAQPYITLPAFLAFSSGVFLFATGCLGSWMNIRNSYCHQGLFVYLLVVVFCLEGTASTFAYFHYIQVDSAIAPISEVFQKYTGSSQDINSRAFDTAQEQLQCCGVRNYTDWMETSWFSQSGGLSVPHSCCNTTFLSCNATLDQPWLLYPEGCQVKLETALRLMLCFIIWGFLLVFLTEVCVLLVMSQLMKKQQFITYQALERDSSH
ncbi:tetraspanin 37 isoform X1 [Kryptolebias marmoratus]|uniref:Tetraspanin n=1 Tax=Kryptolebias marmoratus TaxID=37003 RepID=A0A3Q3AR65_KRYMA|nr:tetraspanin 37 isoform X1 [Kryptolebias marmoratus]